MKSIQEAVAHYLPQKKSGDISLSEIRAELKAKGELSDEDIAAVCQQISDQELASLEKKKTFKLDFLEGTGFSVFMILATIAIFIYSLNRFQYLRGLQAEGAQINDVDYFLPAFFMLAGVIYFVRHLFRLIKRMKR